MSFDLTLNGILVQYVVKELNVLELFLFFITLQNKQRKYFFCLAKS